MQDEEAEEQIPTKGRSKMLDVEEEDEEDDDDDYITPEGGFMCQNVVADGLPKGPGIPTEVQPPQHCQGTRNAQSIHINPLACTSSTPPCMP